MVTLLQSSGAGVIGDREEKKSRIGRTSLTLYASNWSAVSDRPGAGRAPRRSPDLSLASLSQVQISLGEFPARMRAAVCSKCFLFFHSVALLPPPVSHAGWQLLPRPLFALFHQTDFESFYLRVGSLAATSPVHS